MSRVIHDPLYVRPCAPCPSTTIPSGPQWTHEPKLDGWRIQALKAASGLRFFSRGRTDYSARLPSLCDAVASLPARDLILDAELCLVRDDGTPHFWGLQREMRRKDPIQWRLQLFVFDLLWINGEDHRARPLTERRGQLEHLLRQPPAGVQLVTQFEDGEALLAACEGRRMEGVVSKRLDRPYVSGPCRHWLKTKCQGWREDNAERWRTFERG